MFLIFYEAINLYILNFEMLWTPKWSAPYHFSRLCNANDLYLFVWLIIWKPNFRHSPNTHAFFYVSWCHWICQVHNKFSELFHINDVLWIIRISIDDFCTPRHLEKSKYCVYRANWCNNLLHITTQHHSSSSVWLLNANNPVRNFNINSNRDIMSKCVLPSKTNIKLQCGCFIRMWNFFW